MQETWRRVVECPRYEVSSLGSIRNCRSGQKLKISNSSKGYPQVKLFVAPRQKTFQLARLVADAFLPPPNHPQALVRMRDGNRENCAADNLIWALRPTSMSGKDDFRMRGEWRYPFDELGEA